MYRTLTLFFFFLMLINGYTQEKKIDLSSLDQAYREDQFFLGATLNFVTQTHSAFSQNALSGGFQLGFVRDIPLNKQRNIGIGLGLGYNLNIYNTNLFVGQDQNGESVMLALDQLDLEVKRNRFTTQALEVPIQFRWRTSTSEYQKFYRIYAGFNFAYTFNFKANYRDTVQKLSTTNPSFLNQFRTGAHLVLGHGAINFYVQYYFDSLLEGEIQNSSEVVNFEVLKFGLIFYIL